MAKQTKTKTSELEILREKLEKFTEANRQNQREYKKRRRDKGEVLVALWVPKRRVEELKQIAKAMCLEKPKAQKDPFGAPLVPVTGDSPGWSYLKVEPGEAWLQMMLKANKAQWQNKTKKHPNTWRIRSDLIKAMGLEKRVVATEQVAPKHAKKPAARKKAKTKK